MIGFGGRKNPRGYQEDDVASEMLGRWSNLAAELPAVSSGPQKRKNSRREASFVNVRKSGLTSYLAENYRLINEARRRTKEAHVEAAA